MILTGETMSSEDALSSGLIAKIFPQEELLDATIAAGSSLPQSLSVHDRLSLFTSVSAEKMASYRRDHARLLPRQVGVCLCVLHVAC